MSRLDCTRGCLPRISGEAANPRRGRPMTDKERGRAPAPGAGKLLPEAPPRVRAPGGAATTAA